MSDHLFNFFFVANKSVIFPCSQTLGLLNDVKMIALKSRLTKTETKAVLITERSLAEAGVDDVKVTLVLAAVEDAGVVETVDVIISRQVPRWLLTAELMPTMMETGEVQMKGLLVVDCDVRPRGVVSLAESDGIVVRLSAPDIWNSLSQSTDFSSINENTFKRSICSTPTNFCQFLVFELSYYMCVFVLTSCTNYFFLI